MSGKALKPKGRLGAATYNVFMPDTQLYLAIGVPMLFNGVLIALMSSHLNARLSAMQSEFHALIGAQEKLFTEKLLRVEQVLEARLRLIEDKLGFSR